MLVTVLLAPAACSAAQLLARVRLPGPVELIGDRVLVQQELNEIDSVRPGEPLQRLVTGPGPDDVYAGVGTVNGLDFSASSDVLAFGTSSEGDYRGDPCFSDPCESGLSAGPVDGPYQPVTCVEAPFVPSFVVAGTYLAYVVPDCLASVFDTGGPTSPSPAQIVVDDESGAAAPVTITLPAGVGVEGLAMAGATLAVLASAVNATAPLSVMEWNATTGVLLLDQPLPPGVTSATGFGVQADGTAAFVEGGSCPRADLLAPGDPNVRYGAGCATSYAVKLANGALTYIADDAVVTDDGSGSAATTAVVLNHVPLAGFDTDGTSLVLSVPTCDRGWDVELMELRPVTPSRLRPDCPGRVLPGFSTAGAEVRFRVACPLGCVVRMRLLGRHRTVLARTRMTIPQSGRIGAVNLFLSHAAPQPSAVVSLETLGRDGRYRSDGVRSISLPRSDVR